MESPGQTLTLSLLPQRKTNWRALGVSFVLQTLIVLLLVQLGLIQPQKLLVKTSYHLTPLVVVTNPMPVVPKSVVHPRLLPPAPVITAHHEVILKHEQPPVPLQVKLPPAEVTAVLKPTGGARTPMLVRTGEFGSSLKPTINKPVEQVQTGGFGDERGSKRDSNGTHHLVMASLGSFDRPAGAALGNGSGNQHGTPGVVASAGFGSNIAVPSQGDGRSNGHGSVQAGAFGDTRAVLASTSRPVESPSPTTPVEILSKPAPLYTVEARQLHIEGEVLLNVMFAASGEAHVLGVTRGLGHGLDEAAMAAASKIHFRPARRDGHAVDSTAVLHVIFQLAN